MSNASFSNRIRDDEDCGAAMPFYEDSHQEFEPNSEFEEPTHFDQNDTLMDELSKMVSDSNVRPDSLASRNFYKAKALQYQGVSQDPIENLLNKLRRGSSGRK